MCLLCWRVGTESETAGTAVQLSARICHTGIASMAARLSVNGYRAHKNDAFGWENQWIFQGKKENGIILYIKI